MLMAGGRRGEEEVTVNRTPDDTMIPTPYIKDALLNLNANFIPLLCNTSRAPRLSVNYLYK